MMTAPASEKHLVRRDDDREELLALVDANATVEGRTDSAIPGLTFYRFSKSTRCKKTPIAGATLIVVVQGAKTVRIGGETLHADPARRLVITREAALESTVQTTSGNEPYLSVSITFSPETIVKAMIALADGGAAAPIEHVPAFVSSFERCQDDTLVRLLRTLGDPIDRRVIAPLVIEEIALRLLRCDAAAAMRGAIRGGGDTARIESAMGFMRSNAARALSVPQIARHVGMSASHFAHRFREVARVSPMRYLRQLRLGEARALMISEGARPSEIATRMGFESASHFSREFKRQFGAAPAEYARKFRA
jgi:AraC-like DNA-binding protein